MLPEPSEASYDAQDESPSYQQQASYGAKDQSGYRKLSSNTIDTRRNRLGSVGKVVIWVGFGILLLSGLFFLAKFFRYDTTLVQGVAAPGAPPLTPDEQRRIDTATFLAEPTLLASIVCIIASLAYMTMAFGFGSYSRCLDGRAFFYVRYIDWVVTTPLMLHALFYFSMSSQSSSKVHNDDANIRILLYFNDMLMIVGGLIAGTIDDNSKWAFFAFSMLTFLPVVGYIVKLRSRRVDNQLYANGVVSTDPTVGKLLPYVLFFPTYVTLSNLTVVAWCGYPIVWILAEGTGSISVDIEAVIYTVLDVISKAAFGFIIANATQAKSVSAVASANVNLLVKDNTQPFVVPGNLAPITSNGSSML